MYDQFLGLEIKLYSYAIGWLTGWLIQPHNGMVLKIWTLQFGSRFQRRYRKFNPTLSIGLQRFFKWSQKIRNLRLSSKIFGHCQLFPNFPPVPEMLSKIQSDPSPLGYGIFLLQMVLGNTQFEFMEKNICTLPFGSESLPGSGDVI